MNYKICTKCEKELSVTKFSKGSGKGGLQYWCKECCRQYQQSEKGKKAIKRYQQSEKGKKVDGKAAKKYCESKKGKEVGKKKAKKYRQSEKGRKVGKKYYEENKLSWNMSRTIRKSLRNNKVGRHWETLVPYTLEELKQHLENLFQPGMFWDNYGLFGWHVDHVIPRSFFGKESLQNPKSKEFQECWTLENLQPLWAEENLKKNNKLDWE